MERSAVISALRAEMKRLGREPKPDEVSLELYAAATRLFGRWAKALASARGEGGRKVADEGRVEERVRARLADLGARPERRDSLEMVLAGRLRYGAWPAHGLRLARVK